MPKWWICSSVLSADWSKLGEVVNEVLAAGADRIHLDVMDHHYVQNLTLGPKICADLRATGITAPIDVHLMVEPVDTLIQSFAKAGASLISIHPKTSTHLKKSLFLIREAGCGVGLALNPDEPLSLITPFLNEIERILLMSVHPGFAGQDFIPKVLNKARACRTLIAQDHPNIRLEIDGGITDQNIVLAAEAGIDTFVSGSFIFNPASTVALQIQKLRTALLKK